MHVHRAPSEVDTLESNPFGVLSHWQNAEHKLVG